MSNVTISPNMLLPVPVVGADPGPDWANNLNSCLGIIDQHNHTPGFGSPITPSALNINAPLSLQNQPATNIQALVFDPQVSYSTINSLYVQGVDLYFNDGSGGSPIQITSGGGVNATSSGISSGTATASFVSTTLVVNANTNLPANIQCASILLGNNTVGSNYLTLAPPNAMAANYGLVLPTIPAVTSFMQLDTLGNMSAGPAISGGLTTSNLSATAGILGSQIASATITGSNLVNNTITATQIANNTITASQIANNTITATQIANNTITASQIANSTITTTQLAALNIVYGASSGYYSSTTPLVLSLSFTASGNRPVMVLLVCDGGATQSYINPTTAFRTIFYRGASVIGNYYNHDAFPAITFDAPSAGTYTYSVNIATTSFGSITVQDVRLVVYEL